MRRVVKEPARLQVVVDAQTVVEVTAPLPGVLRVRMAPSAHLLAHATGRLPEKRSFAVVGGGGAPLPLAIHEDGEALRVTADAVSLDLGLSPLSWSFNGGAARCVEVRGEAKVGYPVPFYRSSLSLHAPEGEAYLGFGEKVGPLDKRGLRFTFWNTDVLPHQPDTDPLYASIPFFIAVGGGAAWGLFLDESWRSEVDVALARADRLTWTVNGPELDAYLFAGPTPLEVLDRYTALTGRPAMPPLWSLGAHQSRWGYESRDDVLGVVAAYRAHGLPLDCVHLDIDHLEDLRPHSWDTVRFGEPEALVAELADAGVKVVTIVDPAIPRRPGDALYDAALAGNHLVRTDRGEVLEGEVWPTTSVWPDFTRAEVRRFWADWHGRLLRAGVRGVWNDMNEPSCFAVHRLEDALPPPPTVPRGLPATVEGQTLPYDARHGDRRHLEVHNVYGLCMAEAAFEAQRRFRPDARPFILTRAAFAGIARHAALWTGDNSSHWAHVELSLTLLQGLGTSGVPFAGADVPGFLGAPSPELMLRWTQAAVFYPFLRNHSARGTPPKEPWRFGEAWLTPARVALLRRYRLLPTLYTLMRAATETGAPPLRPLALHFPRDGDALWATDQFLFGEDLLVAPVTRPGQTRRMVYLPAGRWYPFENLTPGGGGAGGREPMDGPTHVVAEAPLEVTPAWLRAGGGVVLTAPALHTTTACWPELDWHLGVASVFEARLHEDAGDGEGEVRETTLRGAWDGVRALRLTRGTRGGLPFSPRPERVFLHGLPPGAHVEVEGDGARTRSEAGVCVLESDGGWEELRLTVEPSG